MKEWQKDVKQNKRKNDDFTKKKNDGEKQSSRRNEGDDRLRLTRERSIQCGR